MQLPGTELVVFWLFSAGLVLSALMVITMRNPVYAALSLVLSFFCGAILWLPLNAEFLAILLILIYVGAIMVLFLFVIMMLDVNLSVLREGFTRYLPLSLVVTVLLATGIMALLLSESATIPGAGVGLEEDGARQLGHMLFTDHLLPFEAAGALLVVAIIAALGINPRRKARRLVQDPAQQVVSEARISMVSGDQDTPLFIKDNKDKDDG